MTTTKQLPSQADLQRDFTYYPSTGLFVRHKPKSARQNNATVNLSKGYCGSLGKDGYVSMTYKGKSYQAHRLIWKYMTGKDPDIMDHINGDKFDNRWRNLRNVDAALNSRNARAPLGNPNGTIPLTEERKALGFTERHGTEPPPSPTSKPSIEINIEIIINDEDFKLPYNDK